MIRFLVILFLSLYLIRGLLRSTFLVRRVVPRQDRPNEPFQDSKGSATKDSIQVLSSCANCGTYFAPHLAVKSNGQVYCSQACIK